MDMLLLPVPLYYGEGQQFLNHSDVCAPRLGSLHHQFFSCFHDQAKASIHRNLACEFDTTNGSWDPFPNPDLI